MKKFTSEDVQKSLDIAIDAHRGQLRHESEIPYVMHSIQVANLVHHTSELEGEELLKAVIVANLHDVILNSKLTFNEIKNEFGNEVANATEVLSEKTLENNADLHVKIDKFYKVCKKIENQPNWVKIVKTSDIISEIIKLSEVYTLKQVEKYLFQLSIEIDQWDLPETLKFTFNEKKEEVIKRYKLKNEI